MPFAYASRLRELAYLHSALILSLDQDLEDLVGFVVTAGFEFRP